MGHARALLALEPAQQILAANEVVARKLSVRDTEALVHRAQGGARQTPLLRVPREKPRDVLRLEEQLSDALAATVEIRLKSSSKRGQSGEVAIRFDSLDELNGLLERLGARELR